MNRIKKLVQNKTNSTKKLNAIILSISLIIISGLIVELGIATVMFLPIQNKEWLNLAILSITAPLGMIAFPYFLNKKFNLFTISKPLNIKIKNSIFDFIIIIIFSLFVFHIAPTTVIQGFLIGTCEEFLFRYYIYNIIITSFDKNKTFIIGALLFATLLHINGSFITNILIKFPAGILLYWLMEKFGLQSSIAFHWSYNLIVQKFL